MPFLGRQREDGAQRLLVRYLQRAVDARILKVARYSALPQSLRSPTYLPPSGAGLDPSVHLRTHGIREHRPRSCPLTRRGGSLTPGSPASIPPSLMPLDSVSSTAERLSRNIWISSSNICPRALETAPGLAAGSGTGMLCARQFEGRRMKFAGRAVNFGGFGLASPYDRDATALTWATVVFAWLVIRLAYG